MMRIFMLSCLLTTVSAAMGQEPTAKSDSFYSLSPIEVRAIRASDRSPFTKSNLNKKEILKLNQGQDLPFLLNQLPSVVINSDAGNGVGYTGMRIRGTDATRINITLNGIPYNDAESQGTFFVNLPDFSSSVNSIQVQRGVGTSSNGTGAFGATVSLSTNEVNTSSYAEINNSYGSFDTWKNTIKMGTGLINDHFTIDARLSRISSSGYIDRASSDLQAFYVSGAYLGKSSSLRFNIFSGKEKTYQAWNGISKEQLAIDRKYNPSGTDQPGEPYNNETDNYRQTHYQLFYNKDISKAWQFSTASFLTRGLGYYENYKGAEAFADYNLPDLNINGQLVETTDLVRQKWLDNYFYGQIFSLLYKKDRNEFSVGGGWTHYDGDHFGKVIWAQYGFKKDYEYYRNDARKTDANLYTKWNHQFTHSLSLFTDVQYRYVNHIMNGFEERGDLSVKRRFNFLNPKAGISYNKNGWQSFLSYAVANKEPNRDDFEAGVTSQPRHETLHDIEAGVEKRNARSFAGLTFYYMAYRNQLVLTGQINDVGAATRINVPKSYRTGIELQGGYTLNTKFNLNANLTLSKNKIRSYIQYMDQYDADFEYTGTYSEEKRNTDIAFSPGIISSASVNFVPVQDMEISLINKYVGKQFLDNTQADYKYLDDYYTGDVRVIYTLHSKLVKEWNFIGQINNVLNRKYEANGWTYPYQFNGTVTADNGYFPMAGTNFMLSVNIKL